MKNLFILIILACLGFNTNLSAETTTASADGSSCQWKSWFKYPKNNGYYEAGKSVYVRVDTEKY